MPPLRPARFTVHADRPQGRLLPLWFGHNLEHTRSCVWRGLSAQLLRNRKFAGKPEQLTGQAMGWYALGAEYGLFLLDATGGYTRHHDADERGRRNEVHCQRIFGYCEGVRYGLGQDALPLQGGTRYEARFVLRSAEPLTVSLQLLSHDRSVTYAQAQFAVGPGEWSRHDVEFVAPATDDNARLELSFVGVGELAIGSTSLLPADTCHGLRRDVIALLREIGTPLLRWPGGNFAGDYRWQDGLLEVDQRAPLQSFMEIETLPHTFGYDTHEIGTDEFMALCRELGAEPFISINLAWDSPADAAAWVEYCNGSSATPWGKLRADRGHPEPFGVKYWSLGNELGYQHMEGPNDPAEYARRARAATEAMRQADPAIVLVASGAWWDEAWYTECLAPLSDVVDHISHHWYQQRYVRDFRGPAFSEQYEALIAAPGEWLTQMRGLRDKMQAHVPAGRFVGISFDEWNTWYAWYRTPGVTEGIYAAAMLDAFCKHAAEVGMTLGCYFEPVNEGAIVVAPHDARLTAIGQVLALYRAHHGHTAVEAVPGTPDTRVVLTASLDGAADSLVLTLLNLSHDTAYEIAVDLPGLPGMELLEAKLLRSDDCLPGSVFTVVAPEVGVADGVGVKVILPPMALAGVKLRRVAMAG
jgi:alpha-L-arabinofuranosidase